MAGSAGAVTGAIRLIADGALITVDGETGAMCAAG